ncbi:MAG: hypothetical protein WA102_12775 [Candidatus Methanoperedens sp.]
MEIKLEIFDGIIKPFEGIIKSFERRGIRNRLQEIREERFKHKFVNRFADSPEIQDYIDELDKEEEVLKESLKRL